MRRLITLALLVAACAAPTAAEDEPPAWGPIPGGLAPIEIDPATLPGAAAAAYSLGELPPGLVDEGRRVLAEGGRGALLRTRRAVGASPAKSVVRAWSVRFRDTDDLGEAWALAQAIRFADHMHWGTIWTHDHAAQQVLGKIADDASQPWKGALAAECLGRRERMRTLLLDRTAPPALRAFGGANLGAPEGVTESAARAVLTPLLALLAHDDENVRAMAAKHAAAWCATLDDQQAVLDRARSEPSPLAAAALFASLRAFGVPTARAFLADVAADADRPGAVRTAARAARQSLAIRPDA